MNAVKHTPGPWTVRPQMEPGEFTVTAPDSDDPLDWEVALIHGACGYPDDQSPANAALIAAAPELHSAATKLLAAFDELQSATTAERIITGRSDSDLRRASNEAVAELRAAIAKAEGRS